MARMVVDPITRIEGHLRVEAQVDGGKISDAWSSGTMFRGIELIVRGRDPREAWWVALNHIDPERDIQFTLGPVDQLEHASRLPNFGSKMGVDATRKLPSEGFTRPWPDEIKMDSETRKRIDAVWPSLGLSK